MLRWACVIIAVVVVFVSAVEYVWNVTPVQQVTRIFGAEKEEAGVTVIRLGVASWQMAEFPWEETIRRYEQSQGGRVKIKLSVMPETSLNSLLLMWKNGFTEYDVLVAFYDGEIHPFIKYGWNDPARRSLLVDVREYLSPEEIDAFVPAFFAGSTKTDPDTGKLRTFSMPWMGEVLALNYNKVFFKMRGITKAPDTWEEVEEACKKLMGLSYAGQEVAPLGMNFDQKSFFGQNCYIPLLAAFKKKRGVEDKNGRLDVESPEAVRVFETLKRWYKAGYISKQAFVSDSVDQNLRTLRCAMYPHWQSRGLWGVDDHGPDVIGIAATPGAAEAGSLAISYGCIFPKCSPVKEKAIRICYEIFCTDEFGFQSAVTKGFELNGVKQRGNKMPVQKSMYKDPDLPPGVGELGAALDRGYFYPDPENWTQCSLILVVEFQKYLRDYTPTAEEALANVRRRLAEEVYAGE